MEAFSKTQCAGCTALDGKLREFLKTVPPNPEEEPVKDPTIYMCRVHAALYASRMSGKLVPFPLSFVMDRMKLHDGKGGVPEYEAEFPSLEGKDLKVTRVEGKSDTFEVEMDGHPFTARTDVGLEEGTYVFHEPWVLTHGYWVVEGQHRVPPEALETYGKYHAFPVTYDEEMEKGTVQVYCEKPHLTRDGKRCRARVTDVEPHHVVCPGCSVEIKLWEYAVGGVNG